MNIATDTERWSPEVFWAAPPKLPEGLGLVRHHSLRFAPRPGPNGVDAYEEVSLETRSAESQLLVAFKSPLLARDVPSLKRRLLTAIEATRRGGGRHNALHPALFTDAAAPAVRDACLRERLALIDQTGTVLVHDGPLYVHIEGTQRVRRRARATLFRGKGTRVLRCLLEAPGEALHAKQVAGLTQTSFAYGYAVLTRLEEDGFVERRSPRIGFRLVRPVELLRAWLDSGYRAAASVEGFYAPSTTPKELERLAQRLERASAPFAFTLLSATEEADVVVGGTPHGLYLGGDERLVVETLKLRKVTPHNFLILRPEPYASTSQCGVFRDGERAVSEVQQILDAAAFGGARGTEQSEHLFQRWAQRVSLGMDAQ